MDGSNFNLKFQALPLQSLEHQFLDIRTCPLHIVHNAFHETVTFLSLMWTNLHSVLFYFYTVSCTISRLQKHVQFITSVISEYALRHSTTRRVTLGKVLVRLIESSKSKEYFLKILLTTSVKCKK